MREENSGRGLKLLRWASRITAVLALVALCWIGMTHPKTPLPPEWNPLAPLDIRAPLTPITKLKFQRALHDPELCRAALATGAIAREMSDRVENEVCHIRNRVSVESVAEVRLAPVEMRCDLALRTAMWAEHGLKPAAKRLLGTDLTQIDHFSSYNCRAIRTPEGGSTRMSLHATAEALDVSGFRFTDGNGSLSSAIGKQRPSCMRREIAPALGLPPRLAPNSTRCMPIISICNRAVGADVRKDRPNLPPPSHIDFAL